MTVSHQPAVLLALQTRIGPATWSARSAYRRLKLAMACRRGASRRHLAANAVAGPFPSPQQPRWDLDARALCWIIFLLLVVGERTDALLHARTAVGQRVASSGSIWASNLIKGLGVWDGATNPSGDHNCALPVLSHTRRRPPLADSTTRPNKHPPTVTAAAERPPVHSGGRAPSARNPHASRTQPAHHTSPIAAKLSPYARSREAGPPPSKNILTYREYELGPQLNDEKRPRQ
ncbi:hypothetical protein K490DRAFT_60734 [Saccharata proteae CBS 121410]|uniref:Uncharacterized protein n=1 Tax=Saccharata proteae CBS 121410 TaxID=1314787 RepID=A0A9P4HMT6_9PEZI|nr:hypothetical protein K490DRAFT_60734 [Saccharata proteae CBS 121410]